MDGFIGTESYEYGFMKLFFKELCIQRRENEALIKVKITKMPSTDAYREERTKKGSCIKSWGKRSTWSQ